MRKTWMLAVMLVVAGCDKAGGGAASTAGATPKTDEEKTFYALGADVATKLSIFNMTPAELELFKAGLTDQATGKQLAVKLEEVGPNIPKLARERAQSKVKDEKLKAQAFLAEAAKEQGAEKTPSGLVYKELTAGSGESPKATDFVKVHYKGTLPDGTEFDSSYKRNEPTQFPLNGVIPCWTEGVQKMKVGGKARLVCPSEIAYGDNGAPPKIPGGAALVFEVELLEIVQPPSMPAMPNMPANPAAAKPAAAQPAAPKTATQAK